MELSRPIDYFSEIDKYSAIFKNPATSLYWKVDAIKNMFDASDAIVSNGYDHQLKILYQNIASPHEFSKCNEAIQAIEQISLISLQATIPKERFTELAVLKANDNPNLDIIIQTDHDILTVIENMKLLVSVIRKYPFRIVIMNIRGRNKDHSLFKKIPQLQQ